MRADQCRVAVYGDRVPEIVISCGVVTRGELRLKSPGCVAARKHVRRTAGVACVVVQMCADQCRVTGYGDREPEPVISCGVDTRRELRLKSPGAVAAGKHVRRTAVVACVVVEEGADQCRVAVHGDREPEPVISCGVAGQQFCDFGGGQCRDRRCQDREQRASEPQGEEFS